MKFRSKAIASSILLVATLVVSQISFLANASAAEGEYADVFVYVGTSRTEMHQEGLFDYSWIQVCNNGNASMKSFTFDSQETNWTLDSLTIAQPDQWNTATDTGSISGDVWSGLMDPTQCLTIFQWGHISGQSGDDAVHTFSVTSTTLYDDTTPEDPNPGDNSYTLTVPIGAPMYEVDLAPYIGIGGHTPSVVWSDYESDVWFNVCASGVGTVKSFQLDIGITNWVNTSFSVMPVNDWANVGVTDPGSITSDGLWTGALQAGKCLNFNAHGKVAGPLGENAEWNLHVHDSVLSDDSPNVDPYTNNDTNQMVQEISDPVYGLELSTYLGNDNQEFALNGTFQNTWLHICSSGYGSIESMTFNVETQNWNMEVFEVDSYASQWNNATDLGSVTGTTWNGTLEAGQCIVFHAYGPITGALGDIVSWTVTTTSSTLTGGAPNVDTYPDNDSMSISAPIGEPGDLAIQTRLMTSAETGDGAAASYEVAIQNVGAGVIHDSNIGLYYILPAGASYIGITDLKPDDSLSPVGCQSMGPISQVAPAFQNYSGEVIQCMLQGPQDGIAPGSSYPFRLDLGAAPGESAIGGEVYGVVLSGNIEEPDSQNFVREFSNGRDGFRLNINNIMHLTYDPNELIVTVNRCEGYGEVVAVDDACFTVEFSKPIWTESFDQSDLVLVGGGTVSSFEKVSNTKWVVHVNGMTPGGTLELLLGVASVADYSAVQNGAYVLGTNVVRYAAVGTAESEQNSQPTTNVLLAKGSTSKTSSVATASSDVLVADQESSGMLASIGSGLVAEMPEVFSTNLPAPKLLLGSLSIMKNNVMDFSFILINVTGIVALVLIIRNRKRKSIL